MHPKKLILLDEATSNIDINNEETISNIMEEKFKESTMFIIAHRIKTVLNCDQIMVLDAGEIVEFDSPQNL